MTAELANVALLVSAWIEIVVVGGELDFGGGCTPCECVD